jgi:hypothetical protein
MRSYHPPETILGVDFSGAADAGRHIWVATGVAGDDGLAVTDCRPATDLLDVRADRSAVLPALCRYVAARDPETAVGLDFPFALPAELIAAETWGEFVYRFPDRFDSPDGLRERCSVRGERVTGGERTELRRETETPLGALSPYNVRLANQTFHGIRDLLRPLVLTGAASAVPMERPRPDRPTLLEIYPAGTLADLDLRETGYKDGSDEARARRRGILDGLREAGVTVPDELEARAVDDGGGDALDAIVAAYAASRNTADARDLRSDDDRRSLEGHVYV